MTAAASGWFHTCVAFDTGVYCLGDNSQGQLGNDSRTASSTLVPVATPFGDQVLSLASKALTTCALLKNGDVWCWGNNNGFASGVPDPNVAVQATPARVDLGDRVAKTLAVGSGFGCVTTDNGELVCWGSDYAGQVGVPSASAVRLAVVPTGGKFAVTVGAAYESACAVFDDGSTSCWGANHFGQLGLADQVD